MLRYRPETNTDGSSGDDGGGLRSMRVACTTVSGVKGFLALWLLAAIRPEKRERAKLIVLDFMLGHANDWVRDLVRPGRSARSAGSSRCSCATCSGARPCSSGSTGA